MTIPNSETDAARPSFFTRQNMAYLGFVVAIILVTTGMALWVNVGAGLFAGGLLLAVFSFLLGDNG